MLIHEIIQAISPLQVIGSTDDLQSLDIRHLLTDSRQLASEPDATLFFALKTQKNDGARYIPSLMEKGVHCFVLNEEQYYTILHQTTPQYTILLLVEDTLVALQQLAAYKRSLYHGPVIGITGSNGKTVVKEWLYQLLKDDYRITRSPKSYNSQIGVPLSVWQLSEQTELAIFEAGISEMGEMARLQTIIQPTIGVITYIGYEHGENFPSLEVKRAEKMQLFVDCDTIIEDPTHQNIRTCAGVMRALGYDEDTIAQRILHQTHETILEINLSAMVDNVCYFRSLLPATTMLTCMVKGTAEASAAIYLADADGNQSYNYPPIPFTTEWTKVTLELMPSAESATMMINTGACEGTFWLDDISLIEKGKTDEYIVDGNFPTAERPAAWNSWGGTTPASVVPEGYTAEELQPTIQVVPVATDLVLTFNGDDITVSSATEGVTASGTGKYVKDGEKMAWGNKDRDGIYLEYNVDFGPKQYAIRDTLVSRSREVIIETFSPTFKK